jgi:hypothetical protein
MDIKTLLKKLITDPKAATTLAKEDNVPAIVASLRGAGVGIPPPEEADSSLAPRIDSSPRVPIDSSNLVSGDTSGVRFGVGNRPTAGFDPKNDWRASLTPMQKIESQLAEERDYKGFSAEHPFIGKDRAKRHNWLDVLGSAGIGTLIGLGSGGGIGAAIGGAGAGTIAGVKDRNFNNKWINALKDSQLKQQYGTLSAIEDDKLAKGMKAAQINNIYTDNETTKQRNMDLAESRRDTIAQRERTASESRKAQARTALYKSQYFDPANPAHRAQAEASGLNPDEMPKVDLRKRDVKTIGDTTFILSPDGNLEDSGIPKQGNKSLVDFTIVDPNTGVESKYTTTSEKAASLKQSFANAGMQIKAASERQASQQSFTREENEKNRQSAAERQQTAAQLQMKLTEFRNLQERESKETDFNRKKQLQDERIQAAKDMTALRELLRPAKK